MQNRVRHPCLEEEKKTVQAGTFGREGGSFGMVESVLICSGGGGGGEVGMGRPKGTESKSELAGGNFGKRNDLGGSWGGNRGKLSLGGISSSPKHVSGGRGRKKYSRRQQKDSGALQGPGGRPR